MRISLLPIDGLQPDERAGDELKQGRKEYSRLRGDSGHHRRILAVMLVLGLAAFLPVGLQLYRLMVRDYDFYAALALKNQTRSTAVTADRGDIYDRNMNVLATSVSVENVYLDPHELKQSKADLGEISRVLGEILEVDPEIILEKAKDISYRYQQIGARISEETAGQIRSYIRIFCFH